MVKQAPKIDERTATKIEEQVKTLVKEYTGKSQQLTGTSAALVKIFARFAEIIISRLNRVPEKNFLAFLDLLGASRLPPQSARVPLTFSLAAGTTVDAIVPPRTQVAAPPAEGEKEPVIFETERELVVTAAQLSSVFVRDPQQDIYADYTSVLTTAAAPGLAIFRGNRKIEHIFYIGNSQLLGFSQIGKLKLKIDLSQALEQGGLVEWQIWQETEDEAKWQPRRPDNDGTENLTQLGAGEIEFDGITAIPISTVNSVANRWLRCRLLTPITLADNPETGMVRTTQLPEINSIAIEVTLDLTDLAIEAAFTNQLPIDLSKDFFPFGEKPKFGDSLYLANAEAFSRKDAQIRLNVTLTNPALTTPPAEGPAPPIPPTRTAGDPQLKWEFWNGKTWLELTVSGSSQPNPEALTTSGEISFTIPEQPAARKINGVENFWIRVRIIAGDYGKEAYYTPKDPDDLQQGYLFHEATFAPPSISSIAVTYQLTKEELPEAIFTYNDAVYSENLITQNQLAQQPLIPFKGANINQPSLYLGFTLPPGGTEFPNRTLSLFNRVAEVKYGEKWIPISPTHSRRAGEPNSTVSHQFLVTNDTSESVDFQLAVLGMRWHNTTVVPASITVAAGDVRQVQVQVTIPLDAQSGTSDRGFLRLTRGDDPSSIIDTATFKTLVGTELLPAEQIQLSWRYWNGQTWTKLTVRDETEALTRSGIVEFLAPDDFAPSSEFGKEQYWLRVQWDSGDYQFQPKLQLLLLNTTMAAQKVTIANEILGSSNGNEAQKFLIAKVPVLAGQQLEVREPEKPPAQELETLAKETGFPVDALLSEVRGTSQQVWVRWHQVIDFYGSGPRDRHYTLDNLTGTITFGDGRNGLIPPLDKGNIRLAFYQTGGGKAGNKLAKTIVQLKTTVPYVDKAINYENAAGGADAETLESLLERAPRQLRHRQRAVTLEDYQDLARLASPAVARAKCVPLRNLKLDPLDEQPQVLGSLSVIIVPYSREAKPLPSLELINRVQDFLVAKAEPTVNLVVVGPLYLSVKVTAEIVLTDLERASEVERAVEQTLKDFLQPLTGGFEGTGWDFGREPYKSDFYRLLEGISGVDHLRRLEVTEEVGEFEDKDKIKQTGRFLVYSGQHEITLTLAE